MKKPTPTKMTSKNQRPPGHPTPPPPLPPLTEPAQPLQPTVHTPRWGMLDLLDPFQLGVLYEFYLINAKDCEAGRGDFKGYTDAAAFVRNAIDANCGFEYWTVTQQSECRKLADYDNRGGYNPPANDKV